MVNSSFLDQREACWTDTALSALMGHDHRREEEDDDGTLSLDAADEWGLESMHELARLYQVGTGDESNFVDLLGRGVGVEGVGGVTGRSEVSMVARAIADTVLARILLRYI